jgi:hypothetical protein
VAAFSSGVAASLKRNPKGARLSYSISVGLFGFMLWLLSFVMAGKRAVSSLRGVSVQSSPMEPYPLALFSPAHASLSEGFPAPPAKNLLCGYSQFRPRARMRLMAYRHVVTVGPGADAFTLLALRRLIIRQPHRFEALLPARFGQQSAVF